MMPMFVSIATMRRGTAACVARADTVLKTGSIASRKGSATVTPVPRRKVRRERDELRLMFMWASFVVWFGERAGGRRFLGTFASGGKRRNDKNRMANDGAS